MKNYVNVNDNHFGGKEEFNKVRLKLKNVAKFSCKPSDSDSGLDLPLDLRIPV